METAHYSVIQYFHDRKRGEGVNVGVVLVCGGKPHVQFASVRAVFRRFPEARARKTRIVHALEGLRTRLGSIATADDLARFSAVEVGELGFTKQRRAAVGNPVEMLKTLFADLVGEPPPRRRHVAKDPDVHQELLGLLTKETTLKTNVEIPIPGMSEALEVPIAYKNGAMNYVVGKGFVADEDRALDLARELAATGHLIASEKAADGSHQNLLVRAELEDPSMRLAIEDVFARFRVPVFTDADALRARVVSDMSH